DPVLLGRSTKAKSRHAAKFAITFVTTPENKDLQLIQMIGNLSTSSASTELKQGLHLLSPAEFQAAGCPKIPETLTDINGQTLPLRSSVWIPTSDHQEPEHLISDHSNNVNPSWIASGHLIIYCPCNAVVQLTSLLCLTLHHNPLTLDIEGSVSDTGNGRFEIIHEKSYKIVSLSLVQSHFKIITNRQQQMKLDLTNNINQVVPDRMIIIVSTREDPFYEKLLGIVNNTKSNQNNPPSSNQWLPTIPENDYFLTQTSSLRREYWRHNIALTTSSAILTVGPIRSVESILKWYSGIVIIHGHYMEDKWTQEANSAKVLVVLSEPSETLQQFATRFDNEKVSKRIKQQCIGLFRRTDPVSSTQLSPDSCSAFKQQLQDPKDWSSVANKINSLTDAERKLGHTPFKDILCWCGKVHSNATRWWRLESTEPAVTRVINVATKTLETIAVGPSGRRGMRLLVVSHKWPEYGDVVVGDRNLYKNSSDLEEVLGQMKEWCRDRVEWELMGLLKRLNDDDNVVNMGKITHVWIDILGTDQTSDAAVSEGTYTMGVLYHAADRVAVLVGDSDLDLVAAKGGTVPWFNRRWTMQEAQLAGDITFYAGGCFLHERDMKQCQTDAWKKLRGGVQMSFFEAYSESLRRVGGWPMDDIYAIRLLVPGLSALRISYGRSKEAVLVEVCNRLLAIGDTTWIRMFAFDERPSLGNGMLPSCKPDVSSINESSRLCACGHASISIIKGLICGEGCVVKTRLLYTDEIRQLLRTANRKDISPNGGRGTYRINDPRHIVQGSYSLEQSLKSMKEDLSNTLNKNGSRVVFLKGEKLPRAFLYSVDRDGSKKKEEWIPLCDSCDLGVVVESVGNGHGEGELDDVKMRFTANIDDGPDDQEPQLVNEDEAPSTKDLEAEALGSPEHSSDENELTDEEFAARTSKVKESVDLSDLAIGPLPQFKLLTLEGSPIKAKIQFINPSPSPNESTNVNAFGNIAIRAVLAAQVNAGVKDKQDVCSVPGTDTKKHGLFGNQSRPVNFTFNAVERSQQDDIKWDEFLKTSPTKKKAADIEPKTVVQFNPILSAPESTFNNEWNRVPDCYKRKLHDALNLFQNGFWKQSANAFLNISKIDQVDVDVSSKIRMLCLDECIRILNSEIDKVCEKDFEGIHALEMNLSESIAIRIRAAYSTIELYLKLGEFEKAVNQCRTVMKLSYSVPPEAEGPKQWVFRYWTSFAGMGFINSPPAYSNTYQQMVTFLKSDCVHNAEKILDLFTNKSFKTVIFKISDEHFRLGLQVSPMANMLGTALGLKISLPHVMHGGNVSLETVVDILSNQISIKPLVTIGVCANCSKVDGCLIKTDSTSPSTEEPEDLTAKNDIGYYKSATDPQRVDLNKCEVCSKVEYCSSSCQQHHEPIHKESYMCRPRGEFKERDLVGLRSRKVGIVLRKLYRSAEWKYHQDDVFVVEIVGRDLDGRLEGYWYVRAIGADVKESVHVDNMVLMVPAEKRVES
ncbi:hypothetical protein HDU76_012402, partial [Blyttiomyces sp. JEL0837]